MIALGALFAASTADAAGFGVPAPPPIVPPPPAIQGPFRYTSPYRYPDYGPPVVDVPPTGGHFTLFGPYLPQRSTEPRGTYVPPPRQPIYLPQGMVLDIEPLATGKPPPKRLDRWREVGDYLRSCWNPPPSGADASRIVTFRLGFSRSGSIIGTPRVTYAQPAPNTPQQQAFTAAARDTLKRCAPLPFTAGLGSAIAGVPFTLRFTDRHDAATDRN